METEILAVVACCSMLAAVLMAAFAYRLNEKWTKIVDEQIDLLSKMDEEWIKYFDSVMRGQKNGRD
jgi:Na+/melibiose symporter-like transporter